MQLIVTKNYSELSRKAGEIVCSFICGNPNGVLGLPTGSTPIGMYKYLVDAYKNNKVSFENITTVNLDEYLGLSKYNKHSYNYFMWENLFGKVNIAPKNTHVPRGSVIFCQRECHRYNKILDRNKINLQVLGIGENGHLGFNEPNTPFDSRTHVVSLSQSTLQANSRFFENKNAMPRYAITMGIADILKAETVLLLACGKNKAQAVKDMITGNCCEQVPASALQLHKNVIVVADEDASSLLS